jgi:hypothetical protein
MEWSCLETSVGDEPKARQQPFENSKRRNILQNLQAGL